MNSNEIISELESTLKSLCSKHTIDEKNIRIMVYIQGQEIKYSLFDDKKPICALDLWKDIFTLKIRMFYSLSKDDIINGVTAFLGNGIVTFSQKFKFDFSNAFLLIYKDTVNNKLASQICHKDGQQHAIKLEDIFEPENAI